MKIELDCLPCFVRQTIAAAEQTGASEKEVQSLLRSELKWLAEQDFDQTPPELTTLLHKRIKKALNCPDPYQLSKEKYNQIALELYPELKAVVDTSANTLLTAVRVSLAGNVIDSTFGQEFDIERELDQIFKQPLGISDLPKFEDLLGKADSILFLSDNAGETVFDRVLIEELKKKKVFYAVNEEPILNDATVSDALQAGIDEVAKVISDGSGAIGTILDQSSEEFRAAFNAADLIISKGQANYELLDQSDRPIFFLLKAKCPVVARSIGCQVGDLVFSYARGAIRS